MMIATKRVLADVEQERINQMAIHDEEQSLRDMFIVLSEEVGEVAQSLQNGEIWAKMTDKNDLYAELIQVAAVAAKMAEKVKRDAKSNPIETINR